MSTKKNLPFKPKTSERGAVRYWSLITAFIVFIGVTSFVMFFFTDRIHNKHNQENILLGAIMDIQIEVSVFHLWFEEYIAGDENVDIAGAWVKLDNARLLAKYMLDGGETMHGPIKIPLEEEELRDKALAIGNMIAVFTSTAIERHLKWKDSGISSNLDDNFDNTYNLIVREAENFEALLIKKGIEKNASYARLSTAIIATWALVIISSVIALFFLGKRKGELDRALGESEDRLSSIISTATDAIITIDSRGDILSWNNAAHTLFDIPAQDILGENITRIIPERFREEHHRGLERFVSTKKAKLKGSVALFGLHHDGSEIPLELTITNWHSGGELFFTSFIRDLREHEKVILLEKIAETDTLTETYNRNKYNELIVMEIDRAARFDHAISLLMIDIDNFKVINDTYGHVVGDYALKTLATLVKKHMRKTNHFLRWGGDEFVVLAVETDIEGAERLSERIRREIDSYDFDTIGKISISVGVTGYVPGETDASFLDRADKALYTAKSKGKNCVITLPAA